MAREGLGRLLIVNADGEGQQVLAVRRYPDFFVTSERGGPAWSPDGKVIVAAAGTKQQNESWLVAVNVADGAERRLTRHPWIEVQQAVWLAGGSGLLVTARDNASAPFQIWFVSWPAGEAVRVTNDLLNYQGVSLTTRGGPLVTVQSERVSSLWLTRSGNLSRAEQLVVAGRRNGDEGLAWTPGGEIIYCSDASGKPELWVVNPDGAGARQLTTDGRVHGPLALAPDGRSVIFTSDRTGVPHIWRMGLDGSQPQQLSEGKGETSGRLTPNGRWLIYQNTPEAGTQRLWKKSLDGGPAVQLTGEFARQPVVSPDGKLVAYFYMGAQVWGIAVLPLDGGTAVRRFPLPPAPVNPMMRWTPDGQALTYVVNQKGVSNIWLQPLAGGAARQLTDFRESRLSIYSFDWSRDGQRLALARGTIISDAVLIQNSEGR
jgi:Tol biopolymer transport system component